MQMVGRVLRPHRGKHDALVVDLRGVSHKHGLPDDNRVWSLAGVQGLVADDDDEEGDDRLHIKQCDPCGYVWRPTEPFQLCPRCGHDTYQAPRVVERRLVEAKPRAPFWPDADQEQRLRYRAKLMEQAQRNRYRPGWVEAKMRWAFGGGGR